MSLLPAATEIVCAIGGRELLVGRSHECDYPAGLESVPVVCRSRIDPSTDSAAIDHAVNEAALDALSLFEMLPGAVAAARPDVVLTQSLCSRCAVDERDVAAAVADLAGRPVEVISLSPTTLADVVDTFCTVGSAIGFDAQPLIARFENGLAAVRDRSQRRPRQRVLCLDWTDPPMQAAHWVPELIELAGGTGRLELEPQSEERSLGVAIDRLAELRPDVVLSAPCGFELPRAIAETEAMLQTPEWQSLRAELQFDVVVADGSNYFNRPGPRLVETANIIAAAIDPDASIALPDDAMQRLSDR